jgi:hypothetical protein
MSGDTEKLNQQPGEESTDGLLEEAIEAARKVNPSDLRRESLLNAIGQYNEGQRGKRRPPGTRGGRHD